MVVSSFSLVMVVVPVRMVIGYALCGVVSQCSVGVCVLVWFVSLWASWVRMFTCLSFACCGCLGSCTQVECQCGCGCVVCVFTLESVAALLPGVMLPPALPGMKKATT